jgi:hypothetical protein
VKRGSAGIAFVELLAEGQLEEAKQTATPAPLAEVIPLRRRTRAEP